MQAGAAGFLNFAILGKPMLHDRVPTVKPMLDQALRILLCPSLTSQEVTWRCGFGCSSTCRSLYWNVAPGDAPVLYEPSTGARTSGALASLLEQPAAARNSAAGNFIIMCAPVCS